MWKEVLGMHTEGAKWRYDATADDQPRQQGMGKDLKPAQRKAPTQDQKKVRRQLQRKTAEMAPEEIFEEPRHSSPAKSWDMDRQVTTPHPLFQSAADGAGSAPSAGDGNMSSSAPSGSGGSSATAANWWEPDPRKSRVQEAQPEQKPRIKTLERERTEFKPREVEDDSEFDPYLVTRCPNDGVSTCTDRKSQAAYIEVAQQCHNEAAHPDPNRRAAHDRAHGADGSHCWSCCGDMQVAAPGERISGRIASLVRHARLQVVAEFGSQESLGDRECEACGYKGAPTLGDTGPTCRQCGSYSLKQGEFAQHRQRMSSLQYVATQLETNIASADGRVLLNPGDQIRLPSGQTTRVRNVRRHETSGDHYYVDTDMGTSVMPYSTRVSVVPNDTQQQSLPGYGDPRANSNSLPGQPQASGGAGAPKVGDTCPVCGGKSLIVSGAKAQCSRCGYQGSSQGNMSFSDQSQQVRVGSANPSPLSAVARRATEVVNKMKENPL